MSDTTVTNWMIVDKPISEVFEFLVEPENLTRWAPYFTSIGNVLYGKDKIAQSYVVTWGVNNFVYSTEVKLTSYIRARRIQYSASLPPMKATYELEPSSAGTIVKSQHEALGIIGPMVSSYFMKPMVENYVKNALESLKSTLEAEIGRTEPMIFLSYRRPRKLKQAEKENEDNYKEALQTLSNGSSQYVAGRIVDVLSREFGKGSVFRDIDTIYLGENAANEIRKSIERCKVVLALIDGDWLNILKEKGKEKKNPDYLRMELEMALDNEKETIVIPLLLEGVIAPTFSGKDPLKELNNRQYQKIRNDPDFETDMSKVITTIWDRIMQDRR